MKVDENGNPIVEAPATDNMGSPDTGNTAAIEELFSDSEATPATTATIESNDKPSDAAPTTDVTSSDKEPVVSTNADTPTTTVTGDIPAPISATEPSEIEALKKQIETLTTLVDTLSGNVKSAPSTPAVTEAEPVKIPELDDLFKDMDFDTVMESKENFIKFFKDAMAVVKEQTKQETLVNIPNVVGSFVQRQASIRDVATEFYGKYPELKRVKQYVAHVANTVSAEQPGWNIAQVLEEAAKRTKETLNIQDVVEEKEKTNAAKPKPSLPGGTNSAKAPKAPSDSFQNEIDELIVD